MKISVVVAVYNGEKTLQSCIDSFFNQTYLEKELIVLDGDSSDKTKDILLKNRDVIAYWESEADRGIAHAWNKALKHVTGDWVLFLGADDQFYGTDVLEDMVPILERSKQDFVYGQIVFDGGAYEGLRIGKEMSLKELKRAMSFPHTAAFNRREFLQELGDFDESFRIAIDYEYVLRKKDLTYAFVNKPVALMGSEGVSSSLITETLKEFRKAQIMHNANSVFTINFWYLLNRIKHKLFGFMKKLKLR
jgi:glycosyltransferase involved in cell wall biosynthesis